jgi:four helix bundle protein
VSRPIADSGDVELAPVRSYETLVAWQKAIDLVEHVYQASRNWPQDEVFGLRNQVRRAAVSVPSNIAEGRGRTGTSEYLHHLSIAHGSLCEVGTQIVIAQRLRYLDEATCKALKGQIDEVGRLIGGLIRSLRAPKSPKNAD